jgi:hypothetical protein
MEEEQKKPCDNTTNSSEQDVQPAASSSVISDNLQSSSTLFKVETNPDTDTELSESPKKQKKNDEIISSTSFCDNLEPPSNHSDNQTKNPTPRHYEDISFNGKGEHGLGYCSFSTIKKTQPEEIKPYLSNPIQQILNKASTDFDTEEDDQQAKLAAAKKLLFPDPVATSFSEVVDSLRNERRQEFCPIYKDETVEEMASRQAKQKPVGSLLSKRICWDDLKRKRDEEERKAQMHYHYGPYGPVYANQQQQQQQSFANPYEQYYATVQNQYAQVDCEYILHSKIFCLLFRWCKWVKLNMNIVDFGLNINSNLHYKIMIE